MSLRPLLPMIAAALLTTTLCAGAGLAQTAAPAATAAPAPAAPAAPAPAATAPSIFGGMKADTKAPVEVNADSLSVNQSDGSATFTGNVLITQGPMRLKAGKVSVVYAAGDQRKIRSLKATEGVTLVNGPDAAEAREASYDVEAGTVTLSGDVVLSQGQSVLAGQQMVVNLADGTARVQGRVRSVLQPTGGN